MAQLRLQGFTHSTVTSSEKLILEIEIALGISRLGSFGKALIMLPPIVPHSRDKASAFVSASHSVQKVGSAKMQCVHFNTIK